MLGDGIGDYERTQSFSIDLSVLLTQIYEDATVFNHREDNNTEQATSCSSTRTVCSSTCSTPAPET